MCAATRRALRTEKNCDCIVLTRSHARYNTDLVLSVRYTAAYIPLDSHARYATGFVLSARRAAAHILLRSRVH